MTKILFLVPHPVEDSGYRYRFQQFLPYLEQGGYESTIWSFGTSGLYVAMRSKGRIVTKVLHSLYCTTRRLAEIARSVRYDLVVIHREVFPFFTPVLERLVYRRRCKVVFSFDDALHVGHGDVSSLNHPFLYRFKYGAGVEEVLRSCCHVIAGNRILANHAKQFNSQVTVVPTVIDTTKYPFKSVDEEVDARLVVGWTGSRSTAPYLPAVEPALRRLADMNPGRVTFRFFGCPEYRPSLPQCESLPFRLKSELDDLSSIDIGIMPLPDTEWTRGKCAFKAIQYMGMGIPTVGSPVGVTTDVIRHGFNGLLANSTEEWFSALDRLVNEKSLRRKLSVNGRHTIEREYSLKVWGPRLVDLFDHLLSDRPVIERESTLTTS